MSPVATIQAPLSYGRAVELGNRLWAKRVLPIGEISYNGRTLKFTRDYIEGLVRAFQDRAYDQVAFQMADERNTHTNDPERFRGEIVDMQAHDDGLWFYLNPTEAGDRVLRDTPNLGVSARIVEQYQRADGKFYPAAIQHVLGTLDPRLNGLGAWQPVDMANGDGPGIIIDLSGSSFPGDEPPAVDGELSDAELADLIDAMSEADAEGGGSQAADEELAAWADSLTDAELAQLEAEAGADAAGSGLADEFEAAFSNQYASAQAREQADLEDLTRPAVSAEDKLARALERVSQGTHYSQEFSAQQAAAIELSAAAAGICGPPDPANGACSARYHSLSCGDHQASSDDHVELARSGAYASALDGLAVNLASPPGGEAIGQHAIELAGRIAAMYPEMGATAGRYDDVSVLPEPSADDLFSTYPARDVHADMAAEIGYGDPQPVAPRYPDVTGLRGVLGL